jgi:hypothetical protein
VSSGTTYRIQAGSVDNVPGDLMFDMVFGTTPLTTIAERLNASPLPYTNNQSTIVATTESERASPSVL